MHANFHLKTTSPACTQFLCVTSLPLNVLAFKVNFAVLRVLSVDSFLIVKLVLL